MYYLSTITGSSWLLSRQAGRVSSLLAKVFSLSRKGGGGDTAGASVQGPDTFAYAGLLTISQCPSGSVLTSPAHSKLRSKAESDNGSWVIAVPVPLAGYGELTEQCVQ